MTCIVGLEHGGRVYIGADSAGTNSSYHRDLRADEKVFRTGPFLMGFTTSFRMGQLLRYSLTVPEQPSSDTDHAFLCGTFIEAVRATLKAGGFQKTEHGVDRGGTFLVGYRGKLWQVHDDYQVARVTRPYQACGAGDTYALGALHTSRVADPRRRVLQALRTAEEFNASVSAPFKVLSSTDRRRAS